MSEGVHLMYPYSGGRVNNDQSIGKHARSPFVVADKTMFKKSK
jgi:hypothetical protein